ncbi:prolipoprotein diacylglyceryl transferase [Mesoplasma entomophilum]|uniref:Diacylglyceryl transferase n=1 Tax=Mesoplasma entomophilum TaxID=2149 RepID=A0A3S5XYV2_9MOLU|nr:prolipoprotein diacylglyceryl transferase family protein [Mesoplasma entomophilum]ATQ35226.1 diacylglyceryl transferase [Mesoplasma entomophilum]ATZ19174.1 prolipoprotein diacylglyceryl transferase [Mesoplasma entomophilum]
MWSTYDDYYKWLLSQNTTPGDMRLLFGLVPAYPVFMFLGICLVILVTAIQMNRRKVPLRELEIGILIIVPIGIIGGTFFGKVFLPNYQSWSNFYKVFFFWQPGMSFFGALLLGSAAGFGWFYKRSKVTQISMWVYLDLILVNILLGHALGRWGNLYNQEILGNPVSYESISWMPNFIKHRLFYFPNLMYYENSLEPGRHIYDDPLWFKSIYSNGILNLSITNNWKHIETGETLTELLTNKSLFQYRSPLFLIEGLGNIILWLLITFGVRNINRFSNKKNNPWSLQPEAYPSFWNPKFKSISEKKLIDWYTLAPVKYRKVKITNEDGESYELTMSLRSVWNKAYYWVEPDYESNKKLFSQIEEWRSDLYNATLKYQSDKKQFKIKLEKMKNEFNKKYKFTKSNLQEELKTQYKNNVTLEKQKMKEKQIEFNNKFSFGQRYLGVNPYGKELEKANNPNGFIVTRCGVSAGSYILGYGILRTILETQRQATEYMIPNHVVVNFLVLSLIILTGIFIIVMTQFVIPYKWREIGWLYEKTY